MKKKVAVFGITVVMLMAVLIIWYNASIDLMDLDYNDVMEIVVLNGNTGNTTHITDKAQIENIISDLNDVEMKRGKLAVGYSGYGFRITIYLSDGNAADGWNDFTINSGSTIRKNPFFYTIVDGSIDYDYIDSIVD